MKLLIFLTFSLFLLVGCQSGMSKSEVQNMILENNEFINTVLIEQESDLSDLSIRISYIENQNIGNSDWAIEQRIDQIERCINGLKLEQSPIENRISLDKWSC